MRRKYGYFTGIGHRNTPNFYCRILLAASQYLMSEYKLKLRSGHAVGADRACEIGADGFADIYLPWEKYGVKPYKDDPGMEVMGNECIPLYNKAKEDLAILMCKLAAGREYHDKSRTNGIKNMLYRNVAQIVGHKTEIELSKLVLCYLSGKGGTAYAVALAKHFDIPTVNIYQTRSLKEVKSLINQVLKGEKL